MTSVPASLRQLNHLDRRGVHSPKVEIHVNHPISTPATVSHSRPSRAKNRRPPFSPPRYSSATAATPRHHALSSKYDRRHFALPAWFIVAWVNRKGIAMNIAITVVALAVGIGIVAR